MFTFWLFSFSFLFNFSCVQCIALLVTFSIITVVSFLSLYPLFILCSIFVCLSQFAFVCFNLFSAIPLTFFRCCWSFRVLKSVLFSTLWQEYAHSISNVKLPSALDICVHFGLCTSPSISVTNGSRGGHCFQFWLQSDNSSNLLTLLSYDAWSLKQ